MLQIEPPTPEGLPKPRSLGNLGDKVCTNIPKQDGKGPFVVSGDWIFVVILKVLGILQSGPLVVIGGVTTPLIGVIYSPGFPFRRPFFSGYFNSIYI